MTRIPMTVVYTLVAASTAFLCASAQGLSADCRHYLFAEPGNSEMETTNCNVVGKGSYYHFRLLSNQPTKWTFDPETVSWNGPSGLTVDQTTKVDAYWQADSSGATYEVSVSGEMVPVNPPPPQPPNEPLDRRFASKAKGTIYKPILRWVYPYLDSYWPEDVSTPCFYEVCLKAYPQTQGESEEEVINATVRPTWKVMCNDGPADPENAHFEGGVVEKQTDGVSIWLSITDKAVAQQVYTVVIEQAEVSTASKPDHSGQASAAKPSKTLSIVKLEHNTVCSAAWPTVPDDTRTTIGIAETVNCKVCPDVPATWSTTDAASWDKLWGLNEYWLIAKASVSTPTVECELPDGLRLSVSFSVILPSGVIAHHMCDSGMTAGRTEDEDGTQTGCSSKFACALLPLEVSFMDGRFKEDFPDTPYAWPDGTADTFSAQTPEYDVNVCNCHEDTTGNGWDEREWLDGGGQPIFKLDFAVPNKYCNDSGQWVLFLNGSHSFEYEVATGTARSVVEGEPGRWMGPWLE